MTAGTIYDLTPLENEKGYYEKTVTGLGGNLMWDYCSSVSASTADDYAKYSPGAASSDVLIADDAISPTDASNVEDAQGNILGVEFVQGSATTCAADSSQTYSMKTTVTCDATKTGALTDADFTVTTSADNCQVQVAVTHDAGCPKINIDLEKYMGWLSDNGWAIGIIYLIAGPPIALFGLKWFPYVTASLIAIFVIGLTVSLSMAFGWMTTTVGTVVTLIVALILGILAGCVVRRNVWIMVGLLGLVAGWFSGTFVNAFVVAVSGWEATWGFWVISILMAVIGCVAACYLGRTVVLLSTSMVGSYLFMRAWTLFFPGHYPSEAEIMDKGTNLDYDGTFWIFLGLFIVTFIGTTFFQCKNKDDCHEDLDAYQKAD